MLLAALGIFAITAAWWWFALWPALGDGPQWVVRTRYVCFGVVADGLPDAAGWLGLIAPPIGMLSILLVGWRGGVEDLIRQWRGSSRLRALGKGIGVGLFLGLCAVAWRVAVGAPPLPPERNWISSAELERADRPAPPFSLVAQDGLYRGLDALAGSPAIVTFAYGHCTTVCPLVVGDAMEARRTLRGTGIDVPLVVITLDPWRDTPARLAHIARAWGLDQGAWVLSGSVADVERTLDAWDVPRARDTRTGEVSHPSLVHILDAEGRVAFTINGGADAIAALVRRLNTGENL